MADNTLITFPSVTTVEPPKPSLSKADIAEPFTQMAAGLSEAGKAFTDVSESQAEREAAAAVRTDDSGNLVVDPKPTIVGPASEIYDRTVRQTIANRASIDTQNHMLEMRLQIQNDPTIRPTRGRRRSRRPPPPS